MNIEIVKPQSGPQAVFIQCTADVVCYGGARGGGKSWAIALDFWLHAERHGEDARGLILRKTRDAEVLASRTLRKVQVAARLAELGAEQAKRHEVTIDSLAREFDENRAHALRVDQVAAAVQATAMKAKLFGFMVDRQQVQVEHTLRKPSADENASAEMSLEDWQAKYGGSSGPGLADGRNGKLIEHEH